jgi:hypothetical protein
MPQYLNISQMEYSSSAADQIIKERQRTPTWITTTPFPPVEEVYCSFLAAFNWTNVFVVVDRDRAVAEYYGYAAKRVTDKLADCGVQFTRSTFLSGDKTFSTSAILQEFHSRSRGKLKPIRKF